LSSLSSCKIRAAAIRIAFVLHEHVPTAIATRLAQSKACKNQAFRYGQHAYGFQFHLELDERLINRWLTMPEYL